jgi:hypothetical protein
MLETYLKMLKTASYERKKLVEVEPSHSFPFSQYDLPHSQKLWKTELQPFYLNSHSGSTFLHSE